MPGLRRELHRRIAEFIRSFLQASQIVFEEETKGSGSSTRFSSRIQIRTTAERNRGIITATGKFHPLGTAPFDRKINIPQEGIKPVEGRALTLEKPEGVVFRSRTYTKFAGQTLDRKGFIDEAVRQNFSEETRSGQRLVNTFLIRLVRGIILTVADHFRRAGYRVRIGG